MEKDHLVRKEFLETMEFRENLVCEENEEFLVMREVMAETG